MDGVLTHDGQQRHPSVCDVSPYRTNQPLYLRDTSAIFKLRQRSFNMSMSNTNKRVKEIRRKTPSIVVRILARWQFCYELHSALIPVTSG